MPPLQQPFILDDNSLVQEAFSTDAVENPPTPTVEGTTVADAIRRKAGAVLPLGRGLHGIIRLTRDGFIYEMR